MHGKKVDNVQWFCKRMVLFAVVTLALCGVLALDAGNAHALNYELSDDASLDVDVSLTYGAAWRAKDQDSLLSQGDPANPFSTGSSGDRNFDKEDMINNRFSALVDIDFQYKDYGLFLRPRAYYDEVYDDKDKFFEETRDLHGEKVEILDLFAYGLFEVAGHDVSLRVGEQVVSWGESLFILNGVSAAQSPIDATAANAPGVELKDIFLPVGQVMTQVSLTDNLSLSGFYQWEWEKTRIDEAGSYFSTSDLLDDAARESALGFLRANDNDPDDDGQWGAALRYVAEGLDDAEFGLYYINYHEKLPIVRDSTDLLLFLATSGAMGGQYHLDYSDDVSLYGASVSTVIGGTNVAAEVSYRQDLSVQVQPVPTGIPPIDNSGLVFGNEDVEVVQAQISAISIMPQAPVYDNLTLTAEVGVNRVVGDLDGKKLLNDRSAWGGTVKAAFDYFQVLQNLDLQVPITYKFNPNGISSVLGTFAEKQDQLAVACNFTYKSVYKLGLGYTEFLNDANDNPKADRDFYSLNLKYTF